jgi:ABC-type uncharacterized transport system permease subunit
MDVSLELIISTTLRVTVPIMLASTGASFSVRSGVVAFGCEGMMITGAFCGALGSFYSGNVWIGVACAVLGGMLISLLHAYLHVTHRVNGTLSSVCVNLLGLAMGSLVLKVVWKMAGYSPEVPSLPKSSPGWLPRIPFIGPILAEQNLFFHIAIVLVLISWLVMYRTVFGLRLRMVGENPVAANTVGINTVAYKYIGILICGALSGLGGAYLSLVRMNRFITEMTAGRGYIAMVVTDLGRSNPLFAAISSLFFGFFDSLQTLFQGIGTPSQILMMVPYVFTLIVAMLNYKGVRGPAGVGKHFDD